MKKAFTLIEMMIVVAVFVTLMTILFRISGIAGGQTARVTTISRLQKLENCLSGYYAAFGSYPPVKLHGTRDIFCEVNRHGIQKDSRNEGIWNWDKVGQDAEQRAWAQVQAACQSQPVDVRYPYSQQKGLQDYITSLSDTFKEAAGSYADDYELGQDDVAVLSAGFEGLGATSGASGELDRDATDWRDVQLFKFGLMSYLLPRYLVMMNGLDLFYRYYAQWTANNVAPCDPFTGRKLTWEEIIDYQQDKLDGGAMAHIANITSQRVCARWVPNLEGICKCNIGNLDVYGVNISETDEMVLNMGSMKQVKSQIYSPGGAESDSNKDQYVLDGITVNDGWGSSFYYYSPTPHQRYTLWSAGENGRTFPPWISRSGLSSKANECIGIWTHDDIMQLSN